MSFFNELKRRNVLRVGAAYVVTAWLIVQVVETLFPIYGLSAGAIRLVVNVLAIGLVPVLVLSWVFEWTPQGLKRDSELAAEAGASVPVTKRLDQIILVVLALALGYFAFDKFVLAPQQLAEEVAEARQAGRSEALVESYGEASIAVLAFTDMSPDKDQEYLSDGIAEEILHLLARVPELRVISRSSAFSFKGKDTPIPEIARQLNVAHILEGSVRKSGDRIRITAQLIEAGTDTHIWSETYDRTLDDIFAIQDELAAAMVDQLQLTLLGPPPTSIRTDPEMYAKFLQVKQLIEQRNEDAIAVARTLNQQVLAVDPNYVPALEKKIWLDYMLFTSGLISEAESDEHRNETRRHILSLDPDNGVVFVHDAWEAYEDERDIEHAASVFQVLVENHPNDAEVLRIAGGFLRRIGKFEQAIELLNRCVQIDPLKLTGMWQLKEAYLWSGEIQKAQEVSASLNVIWGPEPRFHDALLLLLLDMPQETRELVSSWENGNVQHSIIMALIWHDLGEFEKSEAELARLDELWGREYPQSVSQAYAYLGQNDKAFKWLSVAMETEDLQVYKELFVPFYWNLHDDPRWATIRELIGLSEERLSAIDFEVRLPD